MKEYISKNELDNRTIQPYIVHLNFHLKLSSQWGTPQYVDIMNYESLEDKVMVVQKLLYGLIRKPRQ
jgi:hypothetical protein